METVYITQDNCSLQRCDNHLVIKKKGAAIGTIPVEIVKTIIIFGGAQVTSGALDVIFDKRIDVIYMSKSGRIKGRTVSEDGGGAATRLAQYAVYTDGSRRTQIARDIVRAKIINQQSLIKKYKRYNATAEYDDTLARMAEYTEKLDAAGKTEEFMGIEGISARLYWDCYKQLFKEPIFTKRGYRPAPDFVNAALNLGYAFLSTEISSCLSAYDLDLEISFLHSIRGGRRSLALDIMEEFRAPFIDAWLLSVFNKRLLRQEHFKDESHGFYLTNSGFSVFCGLYHEHKDSGLWQVIFRKQAENLRKAVNRKERYLPYIHE